VARHLRARVPVDGVFYGPGPVSEEVAARITNEAAWETVAEPVRAVANKTPAVKKSRTKKSS